jgi:hypothetical protein
MEVRLSQMERNWPKTIRSRNLRELAAVALVAGGVLFTRGFTWRSVPLLAVVAWTTWFFVRHALWQAAPGDGGAGVRRELIRQGHLLMAAWAWYVLPLAVGALLTFSPSTPIGVIFLAAGVVVAIVNYRAGKRLIAEGNR